MNAQEAKDRAVSWRNNPGVRPTPLIAKEVAFALVVELDRLECETAPIVLNKTPQPLFVYWNKLGEVRVLDVDEAILINGDPEWAHIATLNSKAYLQNVLNKNAKLVAELRKTSKE